MKIGNNESRFYIVILNFFTFKFFSYTKVLSIRIFMSSHLVLEECFDTASLKCLHAVLLIIMCCITIDYNTRQPYKIKYN
jgi:hypothetical protein